MWSIVCGYVIISAGIAATIFISNYVTGRGCPNLVRSAAMRAVFGLLWPYLALLTLRWVFCGGHFYYRTASAGDSARPAVSLWLASPISLFEYDGWKFTRPRHCFCATGYKNESAATTHK